MLFLLVSCHAETPNRDKLFAQDPRLAKTVTISHASARVGEVLEEVEQQTGVHVYASDKDGGAGELITVFVKDLPLADLMTSLWSLLSFRDAAWNWQTELAEPAKGKPAKSADYHLLRPNAARDFPFQIHRDIQKYFEEQFAANLYSLNATLEEKRKNAETNPELKMQQSEPEQEELRLFASLIPVEARSQLLRTETRLKIPRNQWTPQMQEFSRQRVIKFRAMNPSLDIPDPTECVVRRMYFPSEITPELRFDVGGGNSISVVGSSFMEAYWQKKIAVQWLLPGDEWDDPKRNTQTVLPPKLGKPITRQIGGMSGTTTPGAGPENVIAILEHLHKEAAALPILARLTDANINIKPGAKDSTLAQAVAELRNKNQPCMVKWRDGTLLVTYAGWLRDSADVLEKEKAPWEAVRDFRQSASADAEEAPTVPVLARLAHVLTADQLRGLTRQKNLTGSGTFSDASDSQLGSSLAEDTVFWNELARVPEYQTRLQTPTGVSVRYLTQPMQEWAKRILAVNALPADIFLRLKQETIPFSIDEKGQPMTADAIAAYHRTGTWRRTWHMEFYTPKATAEGANRGREQTIVRRKDFLWNARKRRKPLDDALSEPVK